MKVGENMANNNDLKVLELKKQIEKKREFMGEYKKFTPKTTCILELDGIKFNIHTLLKDQVIHLLVKLCGYRDVANKLSLEEEYFLCGFNINDWIDDINGKLIDINYKNDMKKLSTMEQKLDKLLSNEKKVELELEDIANFLK